jgi:hypothetical protein
MGIYSKLPSLNCSNCGVNPLRFEVFVAHFVVVVILENACFRVGRVLERDLGYLPTRFPTLFTLNPTSLYNSATSLLLPLCPPEDPVRTLEILGSNLDEDFLLLLPSSDDDGYVLKGYVTCFPAGFNTKEKFGLKLRDIHGPVPGYKEKIGLSMDRFFERLEVGRVVLRSNWSITTHGRLFAASGNHLYAGEDVSEDEIIDMDNVRAGP